MRILVGDEGQSQYQFPYTTRDVILVPRLFDDMGDVYHRIEQEMKSSPEAWKLWHGDSHLIADDHMGWKTSCPTFVHIMERIRQYFRIDIKATRLNWYRDTTDWKPYHHDAAAVDPNKAKTQNLTVGVSFGVTRDISFEHATRRSKINLPLPNGLTYAFGSQVNIDWRHGIPQIKREDGNNVETEKGRISIIAWGWSDMR
jgi:hypothetical protein